MSVVGEVRSRLCYEGFLLDCIEMAFSLRQSGRVEDYLFCVDGIITYLTPELKERVVGYRDRLLDELRAGIERYRRAIDGFDPLLRAILLSACARAA